MDSNYSLNDYHEQNSSLEVLLLSENCNSPIHKKLKKKIKKKKGVQKVKLAIDDTKKL